MQIWESHSFKNELILLLKRGNLIPILGSGVSVGCCTQVGKVPSGTEYKDYMIKKLKSMDVFDFNEIKEIEKSQFPQVCSYYEDDDIIAEDVRIKYLKENFSGVIYRPDDVRKVLFEINWPYVYTLNLDDAIENNSQFKKKILPYDEFRESVFDEKNCVIKLHGDIEDIIYNRKSSKVFTTKEYATSIINNAFLLSKLRDDYINQNILLLGCSLDSEIDLLTMDTYLPKTDLDKNIASKTIIFVKGKPKRLQLSNYKNYGITDIVWFDSYQRMYDLLGEVQDEAISVQDYELDIFENYKILHLKMSDKKNQNYFLSGTTLIDLKSSSVVYPYYFVTRKITYDIFNNLCENKVHIVFGRRVSGKSYLLADLFRLVKDRKVYYFDGTLRISNHVLDKMLNMNNILVLFDVGTVNRDQFEKILISSNIINNNCSNFVLNINYNDSDMSGIIKWKIKEGKIRDSDIKRYKLQNKWINTATNNELEEINRKMPYLDLPLYTKGITFLDHILYTEKTLGLASRFERLKIKIETPKELALLIILAIREKIYSVEVISYNLEDEIINALGNYGPLIDREDTFSFEKSKSDLSSIKYVLNAKLWLRRELGEFADTKGNYKLIADALFYIVSRITRQTKSKMARQRRYRHFILFDTLNAIFLNKKGGQISLLAYLYEHLNSLLANDHNFLHQQAKCLINVARLYADPNKKIENLNRASRLVTIAQSTIEYEYEKTGNERLNIAMAHMYHTRAIALSQLCLLEKYDNLTHVKNAIEATHNALFHPYNDKLYEERNIDESMIMEFVNNLVDSDLKRLDSKHICMMREVNDVIPQSYVSRKKAY